VRELEANSLSGQGPFPLVTVRRVPPIIGLPLVSAVTPEFERHAFDLPCTFGVYVQTGADAYTAYALSGGP
jgi:hypothetical protein